MIKTSDFQSRKHSLRSVAARVATLPLALASLSLGNVGCGASDAQTEEVGLGTTQEPISGGNLPTSNTTPFNLAVKLPGCSGSKIGPRRFLTAAHCMGIVNPTRTGTTLTVDNSLNGDSPITVNVSRFFMHPSYADPTFYGSDAAVLEVSQDTPSIPSLGVDSTVMPGGQNLTIMGYGCDSRNPANGGKKQWANRLVMTDAELAAQIPNAYPNYYFFNGGPLSGAYIQLCPGDSGGPIIRNFNDPSGSFWRVTGINVTFFSDPTNTTAYSGATKTGPIAGWLNNPTLAAAHGSITNIMTGKCLSGGAAGNTLTMEACDPTSGPGGTQFWSIVPNNFNGVIKNQIKNGKSGLCLDGGATPGTTTLTLSTCQTLKRQRWSVTANAQTSGEIVQELTGQLFGALGGGNDLFTRDSTNRQRWLVAP